MKNHIKIILHEHALARDTLIVFNVARKAKRVAHLWSKPYLDNIPSHSRANVPHPIMIRAL